MAFLISLTILGRVIDEESTKPMAYAVVIVQKLADSSQIGGTYTNEDGIFTIKDIKPGEYLLSVEFIGYQKKIIGPLTLKSDTNLGDIILSPKPITTKEVVVEAKPSKVRYELDKKVVQPSADIVGKAGSASDVLKGIPGVEVDPQGNVKVRGSNKYLLLVDGRPTNLTLKDIPASQIERIELITNPSAEYDAEGNAIINVILKRRKESGYGINIQTTLNSYLGSDVNAIIGLNTGEFQPYIRLQLTRQILKMMLYGKYVFQSDSVIINGYSKNQAIIGMTNIGFKFLPSQSDEITFELGGTYKNLKPISSYIYTLNGNNFNVINNFQSSYLMGNFLLGYDRKIDENNKVSLTFYSYYFPRSLNTSDSASDGYIRSIGNFNQGYGYGEIKYITNFGNFELNTGYKLSIFSSKSQNEFERNLSYFPQISNYTYEGSDQVHAFYSTLSSSFGNLNYKIGLRLEYINRIFNVSTQNQPIEIRYLSLFPTLNLSLPYGNNSFYFGLSRRIFRPNETMFLPVKSIESRTEIVEGNINVLPEYSNALEFGANLLLGNISLNPEIYTSLRENIIDIEEYPYDSTSKANLKRFINAGKGYDYGTSVGIEANLFNGKLNLALSPYYRSYSYSNINSSEYGSSLSLTIFALLGFIQARFDYVSPQKAVWGTYGPQMYSEIAFMTRLKNFSLILMAQDPFRIYKYEINIKGNNYSTYKYNNFERVNLSFVLQYNFSKQFKPPSKRETEIESTGKRMLR